MGSQKGKLEEEMEQEIELTDEYPEDASGDVIPIILPTATMNKLQVFTYFNPTLPRC